jgi:predicted amidophosphoribosyltransferase
VARLARHANRQLGIPVLCVLRLGRRIRDSAQLDAQQRAVNVAGAMIASAPRVVCRALVVDDIVTSGAMVTEAMRALRDAGWVIAGAAVVAATPRQAATHHGAAPPPPHPAAIGV